jgi:tetratricopeptide (TPR) repeat protein
MLVWRAEALANLDRVEEALQDYDRALKLAPTLLVARLGRGAALIGLGRAEQAVGVLDELRRQYPDHPPTLLALARARLDAGDILGAVAASDGLEDSWPADAGVRFSAARVHLLAGDTEGGLQRLGLSLVARDIWFGFEARVLRFLISRESTPSLHAGALVDAAHNQGVEAWHLPMAQFLATVFPSADPKARKHPVITVEQLLEAAREAGREHVAWYYVAEARRLKSDLDGARTAFRQVVESGLMDTWEYRASIQRLRSLQ